MGLIAGWGRFPVQLAQQLQSQGTDIYCVGLAGHVDRGIGQYCKCMGIRGITRMGSHIRFFRKHGIREVTLAGKFHKILLFQPKFLWHHLPDWTTIKTFSPHFITGKKNRNDDALLTAVIDGYAQAGITVRAAVELAPELLVKHGQLTEGRLRPHQLKDIQFGWELAKEMGRLDIGQTVAVKGRSVLAVEAVEGTDECIRRAGMLCPAGGFTIIKVAKPQQDVRFDVPTIGVGTLQSILQAGGTTLAIESERTIIVDQPEVIRFANHHGIQIVALHDQPREVSLAECA